MKQLGYLCSDEFADAIKMVSKRINKTYGEIIQAAVLEWSNREYNRFDEFLNMARKDLKNYSSEIKSIEQIQENYAPLYDLFLEEREFMARVGDGEDPNQVQEDLYKSRSVKKKGGK